MDALLQQTRRCLVVLAALVTIGMLLAVPLEPERGPMHMEFSGGPTCLVYEGPSKELVFLAALVALHGVVVGRAGRSVTRRAAKRGRVAQGDAPYRASEPAPDSPAPPPPPPVVGPTLALSLAAILLVFAPLSTGRLLVSCTSCEHYGLQGVAFLGAAWVILIATPLGRR